MSATIRSGPDWLTRGRPGLGKDMWISTRLYKSALTTLTTLSTLSTLSTLPFQSSAPSGRTYRKTVSRLKSPVYSLLSALPCPLPIREIGVIRSLPPPFPIGVHRCSSVVRFSLSLFVSLAIFVVWLLPN